jgi:PII-like signaling protein
MTMRSEIDAQVLTVYVGENDRYRSGLLYAAIVESLKNAGIAGVTVFQGVEGFGAHHKLHTARFESLFQGLPVVIESVDERSKIESVLPLLDLMVEEGLVTVQDVRAIRYTKSQ